MMFSTRVRILALVSAIAAVHSSAMADTVTLEPPEGVTTNVLSLFTGDTAVQVSGPGAVKLSPSNMHTGGTTLSGGTLILTGDIHAGGPSPVGTGTFTVSGGTLRGSGTFGGDITGTGAFRIEAPDGWTLTGDSTFAEAVTLADGALGIADGTSTFSLQFFLGTQGGTGEDVSLTMSGGTVTMGEKNLFLSPGSRTKSTFTMTGGAWNMNNHRIIAGYQTTYATNVTDISGTAVITNSEYCYTYAGAGNCWSLNVHDGGLFATKGSLYANGSGAVMDISASNGGEVRANKITSTSGSTTTASVTDGGILGIATVIEAPGSTVTRLSINGGIVRNDSSASGGENFFQFFQADNNGNVGPIVAIGPKGATFRGGGKTAKYAQLYKDMSAIPAGAGETAQGVTFDGGNWAYYTTQSYEGPTILKNGAALFMAKNGYLPNDSVVTVGSGCQLRSGSSQKTVASLTLGEDAILGFADTLCALKVTDSVTLPTSAKIALYNANTPAIGTKNAAGTYAVLQVPAAYADALRAVNWSCATAASGNVYTFSVETSDDTATLSMTIAAASSALDAAATSGGYGTVTGDLVVDTDIEVRGTLVVSRNVIGSETGGTLTIHDGGTLRVENGYIRPVSSTGSSFDLYLEEGGSIIARSIEDSQSLRDTDQTERPMFHFNGGTLYPVGLDTSTDGNRFYLNYQPATVGEHGLVIDLAKWERPKGYAWYNNNEAFEWVRASVQGHIDHDPDCADLDGGITVRGIPGDRSLVLFGGRFRNSTLNGGIRVESGATAGGISTSLDGQTISFAPGSRFRPYDNKGTMQIGNLTLGEAGATEPVAFDGSNNKALNNVVVSGTLSVLSPVAFSVTTAWFRDSTLSAGTYTALVYQASCSVNPALFRLPADAPAGASLSAEEVTLASGDYAGYKALVVTIANDDLVVTGSTSYPTPKTFSADVSCGKIIVGGAWNNEADPCVDTSLTISGNVTASEALYMGYNPAPGVDSAHPHQGFLTIENGATLSVPAVYSVYRTSPVDTTQNPRYGCEVTVNGGSLDVSGDVRFGSNISKSGDKLYSQLTVNGGRVAVGGTFYLYYYNAIADQTGIPGCLVLNDGEVDVTGLLDLSRNSKVNTKGGVHYESILYHFGLYLNGGVLKAENIMMTNDQAVPKVYFNGGTFMPYGKDEANRTMQNLNVVYVSEGGAVISTENLPADATYTIAQPMLTDPALSGAADGGLVKKGAGTLALSGANTFMGPVKVEAGTLVAANAAALSGDVAVADGAVLDLGATSASVARIAASGAVVGNLTVTDAIVLGDEGSVLSVDGDLAFGDRAAIDFGLAADEEAPSGWTPVAAVSGEIALPNALRIRNAGDFNRCKASVADGVLFVRPANTGMALIIR